MTFNEHVQIRAEKFGSVIFETLKEKVFVTNESGKEILDLLGQGNSPEEIVAKLKHNYQAEAGQIRNDLKSFVDRLKENGIIENM